MKKAIAAFTVVALAASPALAAKSSIKVSPSTVSTNGKVTVSGAVGGCRGPVTLYSRAITSKHKVAGIPSVNVPVKNGKFSVKLKITIPASGNYRFSGRCGGKKFGSAKFTVIGVY